MRPIVQDILKRSGIALDKEGQSFNLLCHTALRARGSLEKASTEGVRGALGPCFRIIFRDVLSSKETYILH